MPSNMKLQELLTMPGNELRGDNLIVKDLSGNILIMQEAEEIKKITFYEDDVYLILSKERNNNIEVIEFTKPNATAYIKNAKPNCQIVINKSLNLLLLTTTTGDLISEGLYLEAKGE